jgi:hypothetical protein
VKEDGKLAERVKRDPGIVFAGPDVRRDVPQIEVVDAFGWVLETKP